MLSRSCWPDVQVIHEKELESLGMGALLGVGQGSRRDSAVAVMNWEGGSDEAPIALVGKGYVSIQGAFR